ncbi:DUF6002 family protein [Streptomyces adelaidensis]|uniref:DUF6002 family protein n=1 Tax=Streptomyces adelaidensis TaxID=2796465 RepID=UPI00190323E3|nr:DUF6002 family protein [Streptomyces adelaidensis]
MTPTALKSDSMFDSEIRTTSSDSLIVRYYRGIQQVSERLHSTVAGTAFAPAFDYPELDDTWEEFFSVAQASWTALGGYGDSRLTLLDLTKNPATRTGKTPASLLMVARAVHHIRHTGEPVVLFTPSSGNKAIALRDAVGRAFRLGLVDPDELRIVTLTPRETLYKFRRDLLTESDELRRLNPLMVYDGDKPAAVKEIGREFTRILSFPGRRPWRVWQSLDIANYQAADCCRAFFEYEFGGLPGRRLHAHSVSSAYGLLGYQRGLDLLGSLGLPVRQPGFLLVQHSETSDMVRHFLRAQTGEEPRVAYRHNGRTGLLEQDSSPHFPRTTWAVKENLEPTFYTKEPPTAPEMTGLMKAHGGSGVIVSLQECLARYGEVRRYLRDTDCALPDDPRTLGEWSLVMALTGVLNAVDRKLVEPFDDLVIHGSGVYPRPTGEGVRADQVQAVTDARHMARLVAEAH